VRVVARVDPEKCCCSGGCVSLAPNHFEIGELGYAVPKQDEYGADDVEILEDAAANCPYVAISVDISTG
jgi:ferredoxin